MMAPPSEIKSKFDQTWMAICYMEHQFWNVQANSNLYKVFHEAHKGANFLNN